jgi:hypothetical protein
VGHFLLKRSKNNRKSSLNPVIQIEGGIQGLTYHIVIILSACPGGGNFHAKRLSGAGNSKLRKFDY